VLSLQQLDWDSEFFGFGVGRLVGSFESVAALSDALQTAAENGIRLVYGACDHKDSVSHRVALAAGARFVDAKCTYKLGLTRIQPTRVDVEEAGDDASSHLHLRNLALQAAEFSRFRLDTALPEGSWEHMYSLWMQNSVSGKLADAVFVEHGDDRIIGMISVSYRGECGQIGLFAVDRKWRGRGIGRRLLDAAIQRCCAAGCKELKVVTQRNNLAACRSYELVGFRLIDEQDVFHFWIDLP
jgi:dTDP-4-amino-4,6-dideoxy-D-galactose acyltransferase